MELKQKVFVTRKEPVTTTYIPDFNSHLPVIWEREVLKKTPKGYRLSSTYSPDKGEFHSDAYYRFFDNYAAAVEFVADEANRIASALDSMKKQAENLEIEACRALFENKQGAAAWN